MKKCFKSAIAFLGFILTLSASGFAQTAVAEIKTDHTANGIFYKITGNGLTKPSYLFGTVHIICPADMFSLEKIHSFVDQTDNIYLEVDLDNPSEMAEMGKGINFPAGKSLTDYLTPDQYSKVDAMVKNSLGVSVDQIKQIKPVYIQVIVTTSPKSLGCTAPSSYELDLVKYAAAQKRNIDGLETAASQVIVLDKTPLDKQAKSLYEMALDPQKSTGGLKKLIDVYKLQDSEALLNEAAKDPTFDQGFQTRLLVDRNKAWIPKFVAAMKEKSTFFAVGGAHLAGKDGVISLLRAKGYKVEAIKL